jgi:hypothetical protein
MVTPAHHSRFSRGFGGRPGLRSGSPSSFRRYAATPAPPARRLMASFSSGVTGNRMSTVAGMCSFFRFGMDRNDSHGILPHKIPPVVINYGDNSIATVAINSYIIRIEPADMPDTERTAMFTASTWVEGEIQANIDGYGNTDKQAAAFVMDLLAEGEYREELKDAQVLSAIKYLKGRKPKDDPCPGYREQSRGMELKSVACENCGKLPSAH